MLKFCLVILGTAAAIVLAACGVGEGGTTDSVVKAPSEKLAAESLLSARDLPKGTTAEDGSLPAEPCGPLPILKKMGGETAKSRLFDISAEKMTEAVGIFGEEEEAEAAYEALDDGNRLECIGDSFQEFSPQEIYVTMRSSQSFGVGEENAFVRFLIEGAETGGRSLIDIASIRSGRCVIALIFLVERADQAAPIAPQVSKAAAESLTEACE